MSNLLYVFWLLSILICFLVERVIHALCIVLYHVTYGTVTDIKTYSAIGVISVCVMYVWNVFFTMLAVLTSVFGSLMRAVRYILIIVLIGLVFVYLLEYSPQSIENFLQTYNNGFGRALRLIFFETAKLLHIVISALLPVYNGAIFFVTQLIFKVLIPGINFDISDFLRFIQSFADLWLHLFQSLLGYTNTFSSCASVNGAVNASCFEAGLRTLDLITPMSDVRKMAGFSISIVTFNCNLAAAPLDLLIYPLMDINFAKAVHNIVNSVLLFFVQVPIITKERCNFSKGKGLDVLMCVPDFEPAWRTLYSGMRFLGRCIDNWLNIAALIVEEIITGDAPSCDIPPLKQDVEAPNTALFGINATAVVGLTKGMYAITDGYSSEYVIYDLAVERTFVVNSWPIPIDVKHGIAAVRYGEGDAVDYNGQRTTSMLGCKCIDVSAESTEIENYGISITCAITPFDPEATDTLEYRLDSYVLPVEFQLPSTASRLRCSQIQMSVQSVRWPLTRLAKPDVGGVLRNIKDPLQEYGDSGPNEEPVEADAVVYVIPQCSQPGTFDDVDLVCLDSFIKARCYPYCMAVRVTGSQNSALTLYDSDDWEDRVQLLKRDCGLGKIVVDDNIEGLDDGFVYVRDEPVEKEYFSLFTIDGNRDLGGKTYTTRSTDGDVLSGACSYEPTVITRTRKEALPGYSAEPSIRSEDQPFVVAGDASLFIRYVESEDSSQEDKAFIYVKRLIGAESYQFTLARMPQEIPTLGACQTLDKCLEMEMDPSLVTVPRAYLASPVNSAPSVATRWSVVFVVNPSPKIYSQFFTYCQQQVQAGTQFVIESAYSPIRLWRVDAFGESDFLYSQIIQRKSSVTFDSFDQNMTWSACANPVNMSVTNMAYLNEYNIAVTVLVASPMWYDFENNRIRPLDSSSAREKVARYDVYFLNPQIMELRKDTMWQEEDPVSVLAQGYLCPALRRAPAFGSVFAEIFIANTVFLRFPMTVLVNIPALAPSNLQSLQECPLITRGHTILRECGAGILDLDYFFYSLYRGNSLLWRVFSDISNLLSGIKGTELSRTSLNGIAIGGQNAFNVLVQDVNFLPEKTAKSLVDRMPPRIRFIVRSAFSGIGFSHWICDSIKVLIVRLVSKTTSFVSFLSELWRVIYDQRVRFEELVIPSNLASCTGLALTLGWSNPYAQLAREACILTYQVVPTMFNIVDIYFVHFPMLDCLCRGESGISEQKNIARRCFVAAPLRYRPVISEISKRGTTQIRGMCVYMTEYVNNAHSTALDNVLTPMRNFAANTESVFDYLRVAFSSTSGNQCSNFYSNPFVLSLMPYPIDYWRQCAKTSVCRLRCSDLFEAFEQSRSLSSYLGERSSFQKVVYEKPFFSESEIDNGLVRQPFTILGMIEHRTCSKLCTRGVGDTTEADESTTLRCFSVAGVNNEKLTVAFYCLSKIRNVGTYEAGRWDVAGSEEWISKVFVIKFLYDDEPTLGGPYDPLLLVRKDAVVIVDQNGEILPNEAPIRVIADSVFFTKQLNTFSYLDFVYVIPAFTETGDFSSLNFATVVVIGTVNYKSQEKAFIREQKCVNFLYRKGIEPFIRPCGNAYNLDTVVGNRDLVIRANTLPSRQDCKESKCTVTAALIPSSSGDAFTTCTLDLSYLKIDNCQNQENNFGFDVAQAISNIRSKFSDLYDIDQTGSITRFNKIVSQTSVNQFQLFGTDETVYTFFMTESSITNGVWFNDVRVLSNSIEVKYSNPLSVDVSIQEECTVMTCSSCLSVRTQKLCYAAQQCALSDCIGTTINLQHPSCMWGLSLKYLLNRIPTRIQAFWTSWSSVQKLIIDASTGQLGKGVVVSFPYEVVDMLVCDMKDVIVSVFASFFSLINYIVLEIGIGGTDVDSDASYLSTQLLATLTNFGAHLFYVVLYPIFAMTQSVTCNLNQFLAIFDITGTSVRILPRDTAIGNGGIEGWEAVGGTCLSKLADESIQESGSGVQLGSGKTFNVLSRAFSDIAEQIVVIASSIFLRLKIHSLDALITWVIGAIYTLQDIIYVVDFRNCKLPDVTMKNVGSCACEDKPAIISVASAKQGIADSAFWCTGAIGMVLPNGKPKTIFNPYTFQELREAVAANIDYYFDCISGVFEAQNANIPCHEFEPKIEFLESQGVSTLAVYTRCKSNFVAKQWDEAASLLFNYTIVPDLVNVAGNIENVFDPETYAREDTVTNVNVARCMYESVAEGVATTKCLDIYLQSKNILKSEYFSYKDGTLDFAKSTDSLVNVDACQVFTGPSKTLGNSMFTSCSNDILEDQVQFDTLSSSTEVCRLPYFVWSGRSQNKVPVAFPHFNYGKTTLSSIEESKDEISIVKNSISDKLRTFLSDWNAEGLSVALFTTDGDTLHQGMDCLLMGPYSSVQLWPTDSSIDALLYSRGDPSSRAFQNPCSGPNLKGDNQLPFTCGSSARRALMKYFVRRYLTKNGDEEYENILVQKVIQEVEEFLEKWENSDFGCPCEISGFKVECCNDKDIPGWYSFISNLGNIELDGTDLVIELLQRMNEFLNTEFLTNTYEVLTEYADFESDYAWTLEEAILASDLGLYDTSKPVSFFDYIDAGSPLKNQMSLWDLCTSYIQGSVFTLPLNPIENGDIPVFSPQDGTSQDYANYVERYVRELTFEAFKNSPLYWHHVLRHVPSDSVMCSKYVFQSNDLNGNISYDFKTMPITALQDDERFKDSFGGVITQLKGSLEFENIRETASTDEFDFSDVSVDSFFKYYGIHYHSFANIEKRCVCSWQRNEDCFFPSILCELVFANSEIFERLVDVCNAPIDNEVFYTSELIVYVHILASQMPNSIKCDHMYPSDAWGLIDDNEARHWVSNKKDTFNNSMYEILTVGRSGVRVGNIFQIREKWNTFLHPSNRVFPLVGADRNFITQNMCKRTLSDRLLSTDLLNRFVDELFPVIQAVRGSLPIETCTRFMLETARLNVYELLNMPRAESQRITTFTWKKRCENQLEAVSLCNTRGVFDVIPSVQQRGDCPFFIENFGQRFYVTASCIVFNEGVFYDPCLCQTCPQDKNTVVTFDIGDITVAECKLPIDPREFAMHSEYGGNFNWAQTYQPFQNKSLVNKLSKLTTQLLLDTDTLSLPLSLNGSGFYSKLMSTLSSGYFNTNPNGPVWYEAEGVSSETESTKFCDSVYDWWPESWNEPVGYHVSTPSYADETGYRIFENSFVVDRGTGDFVKIVYEHNYMRNQTYLKNHFGASGVCNTNSYGMPMYVTNTMRACTKTSRNTHADPSVPIKSNTGPPLFEESGEFSEEYCSNSYVLPLIDDNGVRAFSGLVMHWFPELDRESWPAEVEPKEKILKIYLDVDFSDGSFSSVEEEFEKASCSLPILTTCEADSDCQKLALNVDLQNYLKCFRGVCALTQQSSDEGYKYNCAQHSDCPGEKMCSGFGQCVKGIIQFANDLDVAVEAQTFSVECSAEEFEFDMTGASQWENVKYILEDSGMCGYRNWFDLNDMVNRVCPNEQENNVCKIDGSNTNIIRTSPFETENQKSIFEENIMKVFPHVCDKDYMYVNGFKGCVPDNVKCRKYTGEECMSDKRAKIMQTYKQDKSISFFSNQDYTKTPFGFLGLTGSLENYYDDEQIVGEKSSLKFCYDIPQCFLPEFKVNGLVVKERKSLKPSGDNTKSIFKKSFSDPSNHQIPGFKDFFKCGSFGLVYDSENDICILDPVIIPFFYVFCVPIGSDIIKNNLLGQSLESSIDDGLQFNEEIKNACESQFVEDFDPGETCNRQNIGIEDKLPFYKTFNEENRKLDKLVVYLNDLLTKVVSATKFKTFKEYRQKSTCVQAIWDVMNQHPMLNSLVMKAHSTEFDDVFVDVVSKGLYFLDSNYPFPVTEIPFAWWVKCTVMDGLKPSENRIVDCPAWSERTDKITEENIDVRKALRILESDFTEELWKNIIGVPSNIDRNDEGRPSFCVKNPQTIEFGENIENQPEIVKVLINNLKSVRFHWSNTKSDEFEFVRKKKCYTKKEWDTDQIKNKVWRDLVKSWMDGIEIDENLLNDATNSTTIRSYSSSISLIQDEIWTTLCDYWFYEGNGDVWFEEQIDELNAEDNILMKNYNTDKGMILGKFTNLKNEKFNIADILKDFETNACKPAKDIERFSLYLYHPQEEPGGIEEFSGFDFFVANDGRETTSANFVWQRGENGGKKIETIRGQGSVGIFDNFFFRDLCPEVELNNDASYRRIEKYAKEDNYFPSCFGEFDLGVGGDKRQDQLGQSCDLVHNSKDDYCEYGLDDFYERVAGINVNCQRSNELDERFETYVSYGMQKWNDVLWEVEDRLRPVEKIGYYPFGYPIFQEFTTGDTDTPPFQNPAGSVCWAFNSVCAGARLREATKMLFPPGVEYTITYDQTGGKIQPQKKRKFDVYYADYFGDKTQAPNKKVCREDTAKEYDTDWETIFTGKTEKWVVPPWFMCPASGKPKSTLPQQGIYSYDSTYVCTEEELATCKSFYELDENYDNSFQFGDPFLRFYEKYPIPILEGKYEDYYLKSIEMETRSEEVTVYKDKNIVQLTIDAVTGNIDKATSGILTDGIDTVVDGIDAATGGVFNLGGESTTRIVEYYVYKLDFCKISNVPNYCFWDKNSRMRDQDSYNNEFKPPPGNSDVENKVTDVVVDTLQQDNNLILSLSLQLNDKYICCDCCSNNEDISEECLARLAEQCFTKTGKQSTPMQVRKNYYYCYESYLAKKVYCKGKHNCFHSFSDELIEEEQEELKNNGIEFKNMDEYSYLVAIHILSLKYMKENLEFEQDYYAKPERASYFQVPNLDLFKQFDSEPARRYFNSISAGEDSLSSCANIGDTELEHDYTKCSGDGFLKEFKEFVDVALRFDSWYIVDSETVLSWNVDKKQMTKKSIFAYSKNKRRNRDVFVQWLLDYELHCNDGRIQNSVCFFPDNGDKENFIVMNPWVGGDFNLVDFCDTPLDEEFQRFYDTSCIREICTGYANGQRNDDKFYKNIPLKCDPYSQDSISRGVVSKRFDTNLCYKTAQENTTCEHLQSSLGGVVDIDGVAVDGKSMNDLYELVSNERLEDRTGLLGESRNLLFAGFTKFEANYLGIVPLQLKENDIGGHHIFMRVEKNQTFRVVAVVLGNPIDSENEEEFYYQESVNTNETDQNKWLRGFERLMVLEDRNAKSKIYDKPDTETSWNCPYYRLLYWSGVEKKFSMTSPDAKRAKKMFAELNGNKYAHPMQEHDANVRNIATQFSSNGYCFCANPDSCSAGESGPCSLVDTIKSMFDEDESREARDPTSSTNRCFDQIDWPYLNGTLRDGSELPSMRMKLNCSLFERLPKFKYRLVNKDFETNVLLNRKTTSDEGGDCHMARGTERFVSDSNVKQSRCKLWYKNDTVTQLLCDDGSKPVLPRFKSRTPKEIKETVMTHRRYCKDSNSMPTFENKDGDPIENMSSFGIHTRISAERFLSSELYRELCKVINCSRALRKSSWRTTEFMYILLNDPSSLFNITINNTEITNSTSFKMQAERRKLYEQRGFSNPGDELWLEPWVICENEYSTGELTGCNGTIPKNVWLDPKQRFGACNATLSLFKNDALATSVSICDIDKDTDKLCQDIAQAQRDIVEAHCAAAGQCIRDDYFYNPSTFSVSNNEFIRSTVEKFYLDIDSGSCPQRFEERGELIEQVTQLNQKCSGNDFTILIEILESLRSILQKVVRFVYNIMMLVFNFMRLLIDAVNFDTVFQNIIFYLEKIFNDFIEIIKALGDVAWQTFVKSPIGRAIEIIIDEVCKIINWLLDLINGICDPISSFMNGVADVLDGLGAGGAANSARTVAGYFTECNLGLTCNIKFTESDPITAFNQPTKCWSEYITVFGDDSSLSCTAADTCVVGVSSNTVLCATCPETPDGINEFGCDPIRKACACGVPQLERTQCVNNRNCELDSDATCSFIKSNFDVTFGTIQCNQCEHTPICLKQGEVGVCMCALRKVEHESCEQSSVGDVVNFNVDGLCLAAIGNYGEELSRTIEFESNYDDLISVPCRGSSTSSSYCMSVRYNAFNTRFKIVTLETTRVEQISGPFRRLLQADTTQATMLYVDSWDDATGLCRDLVVAWQTDKSGLSVTDKHYLESCLKWRQIGKHSVLYFNLTGVNDQFLLSFSDFALEVAQIKNLAQLVSKPGWISYFIMNQDFAKPLVEFVDLFFRWKTLFSSSETSMITVVVDFVDALRNTDIKNLAPKPSRVSVNKGFTSSINSSMAFTESWAPYTYVHQYSKLYSNVILTNYTKQTNVSNTSNASNMTNMTFNKIKSDDNTVRRLLQWTKELTDVQEFSLQVSISGEATQPLPPKLAENWLTGPLTWPPDYSYWKDGNPDCVAGEITLELFQYVGSRIVQSYTQTGPSAMIPAQTFKESLFKVDDIYSTKYKDNDTPVQQERGDTGWITSFFYFIQDRFYDMGLRNRDVYNLFLSIPNVIKEFFSCDFEEVMFCTKYRRTVWNSFWWVLIFFIVFAFLSAFLQVNFSTLFISSFLIIITLFYSLEYSLVCVPLIPKCALDESIEILSWLFPTSINWPNSLQRYPGCLMNNTAMKPPDISEDLPCLIPCSAEPHQYSRWEAPVAWWLCSYDVSMCTSLRDWLQDNNVIYSDTMQRYLTQKSQIVNYNNADLISAQNICAVATSWFVTPFFLIFVVIGSLLTWLLLFPLIALQNVIQVVVQTVVMSHVTSHKSGHNNRFIKQDMQQRLK